MYISKQCPQCNTLIPKEKRANKFCCQSCAATYNNLRHGRRHGNPAGVCERCGEPKSGASRRFCSIECMADAWVKYPTPEEKLEVARKIRRLAQSKWRANGWRKLDPDADPKKLKEIYDNCPSGYEVDHIIPLSKGGKHHENNLQYLLKEDNRKKGNKLNWNGAPGRT